MRQPQVARLELGEVNVTMDTLRRVSAQLGIEFTIDVRPAGTPVHNVPTCRMLGSHTGDVPNGKYPLDDDDQAMALAREELKTTRAARRTAG